MRVVIVGGGIAAVTLANNLKKLDQTLEILIISDENHPPYDRIHLCRLVGGMEDIALTLDPTVRVELAQEVVGIDREARRVFTPVGGYSYDKLIIATGSRPIAPIDVEGIENAATFRSLEDCDKINHSLVGHDVVIVGGGPIGLELLERLCEIGGARSITLLIRGTTLYDRSLSYESIKTIEETYTAKGGVTISYGDEITDIQIKDGRIVTLETTKGSFENPLLIYGIGIRPNIDNFKASLRCDKGILTDLNMLTDDSNIYAVGECAQVEEFGFIAGHVQECVAQSRSAIAHLLGLEPTPFALGVAVDMLKVGELELVDARSLEGYGACEKVVISSKEHNRVDEYSLLDEKLMRFIGINSNVDIGLIEGLIASKEPFDIAAVYEGRLLSERGRLICSCEHLYEADLRALIIENAIEDFAMLSEYSQAGRVCGRCKMKVADVIKHSQELIDFTLPRKSPEEKEREKELEIVRKRIEKYQYLNPQNNISPKELQAAMESHELSIDEVSRWVSMMTANMQLHPAFEPFAHEGLKQLTKIPVIWLELSDCSGNSEAFIKSSRPSMEELIFDYISLDYHELLMSGSGDQSETLLDELIATQKGQYILVVEGAVPLAMDGKYLRIGAKGETGTELLRRCASDAALIIAVGSCALDGGVVAAAPNPTGAVGVAQALGRKDIINIPGCPANPINIVGTLLWHIMFGEQPELDAHNRPRWAYGGRIHDNCERRGHYELGEFVKEWGDTGAKKGWCLFEMGCKGPYAFANCPTMKFNHATSWPVQAGHGCIGCTEVGFIDKYAHERVVE